MASPKEDSIDPRRSEFMTALLALWAGDDQGAKKRLETIVSGQRKKRRRELTASDPVVASALRTLDQLSRREREFARLNKLAGLEAAIEGREMHVLYSKRKHLTGVVWVRSDREYDLRVYLADLDWEAEFYKATATRSSRIANETPVSEYPYSREGDQVEVSELNQSWAEPGDVLLRIEVSDFCTLNANAIWSGELLPTQGEVILDTFQRLLDELDTESKNADNHRNENL